MPTPTLSRTIAANIAALRKRHKLTQAHLAERAATNPHTVSELERAKANPTLSTLENIARALGVSIAELCATPKGQNS